MSDSLSVAELLQQLAERDAMIEQLRGQLAVAQAEIAELKRRLGQNSSNSSLPSRHYGASACHPTASARSSQPPSSSCMSNTTAPHDHTQ
jgi:hypothetical protein